MIGFVDRTGERHGKLLVVRRGAPSPSGASWWCKCDCGNEVRVTASNLKKGQQACASCGLSHARVDLTGRRFGRLRVLNFAESRLTRPFWLCLCECGNSRVINGANLTKGVTLSCGCLGRERRLAATTKHGMGDHPVYIAWENMKQRCLNPRHIHYGRYGGRGIKVCERWLAFDAFRDDVLPTWKEGLTLDRVDSNGNYEPSNFEWVTRQRQAINRDVVLKIEFQGEMVPLVDVARQLGIKRVTLLQRHQRGVVAPELFMKRLTRGPARGHSGGRTHGMSTHPAYNSWRSARARCQNMQAAGYNLYGGRGITFADHWQEFENFWADMGPSWFEGATLDRKDNDKGYGPDNCQWATQSEQANNRRNTNFIETPLGTMTIGQASRQFGIKRNTLLARVRYGWTDPHELVKPVLDKTAYLKQYRK